MSDIFNPKRRSIFAENKLALTQSPFARESIFTEKREPTLEEKITEQESLAKIHKIPIPDTADKLRIWDVLEWARYPITNMLYTAAKEHKEDDLGWEDVGKILKSAVYGAMLKERRNTEDVLRIMFPNLKDWQYAVFGIAGDVISDPLTWLTFGGAKAGAKGIGAVERGRGVAGKLAAKYGQIASAKGLRAVQGGAKIAKEGVEGAALKAFTNKLMTKYGGRNLNEAILLAKRQAYFKAVKPGLNIRVPFTPLQKQIVKGSRADVLSRLAGKIGVPKAGVKAIREAPARISQIQPLAKVQRLFDPAAKFGPFREAHDIEVFQGIGRKGWRTEQVANRLGSILDDVDSITKAPSERVSRIIKATGPGKGTVWKRNQIIEFVTKQMEKHEVDKLSDELKPIANRLRTLLDEQWDELVKRGLLKEEQYIPGYIPRYYIQDATGEIRVVGVPAQSIEARFLHHRTFETAEEAIKAGFKPKPAIESLRIYLASVNKSCGSYDTIYDIARRYGVVGLKKGAKGFDETAAAWRKKGFKVVPVSEIQEELGTQVTRLRHKGFEGVVVPMEVGNALNRIDLVLRDENELRGLIKFANNINNAWKKSATIYWPGFHMRNEASNIWSLAWKDGIGPKQLKNFNKAIKIFKNPYSDDLIQIFSPREGKYVEKPIRVVYEMFRKHNIHTGGFGAAEMGDFLRRAGPLQKLAETKGGVFGPISAIERTATRVGGKAGSFFENTARIASALNDLEKGLSLTEAARRVNRAFISYADFTKFEGKLKKFIPFYMWLRGNLANQINYIVSDPGKYSMFTVKPLRAINWAKEETMEYMPEWMKKGLYVQPFGAMHRGVPLMLNPNLPFQDVGKIELTKVPGTDISLPIPSMQGVIRMLGEATSPLIKTPVELALNRSYFTGKPIKYSEHATEKAPTILEGPIALLPEDVRMRLGIVKTDRGWEMPARWVYAMMSLIPQAKIGAPIEYMARKETPAYRKTAAPFDIGARTMGLKLKPTDISYYKQKALAERLRELKELTSKYVP